MDDNITSCSYFDIQDLGSTERIIIASTFILISSAIVLTNSLLIYKLCIIKRKSRANLLFLTLSLVDIFVGLLAAPTMFAKIISFEGINWILTCETFLYFIYLPSYLSWILVTVIALDRCLIILYDIKYQYYVTTKRLLVTVCVIIVSQIPLVAFVYAEVMDYSVTQVLGSIFLSSCFFSTVFAYIRLGWFVYYKQRKIAPNKYSRNKSINRLTRTILYTFICQIICNLPSTVIMIVNRVSGLYEDRIIENRGSYWAMALVFANSFLNSLILLVNGTPKWIAVKKIKGNMLKEFWKIFLVFNIVQDFEKRLEKRRNMRF